MRKLLSFILAFTMLFTSVAASAALSTEAIPEFLDKAGIVTQGSVGAPDKIITRGEFVQMISKLIPIDGSIDNLSDVQIFKDIPKDSPIFGATTLLYHMYFIVGDGSGYFEPDAYITAEQACKILVNLMGDQYFAKHYGGYIPAAAAKGILKGVSLEANSTLTVSAAMKLIYNTMIADISNSNLYDGNVSNGVSESEMFMSTRLGIYMVNGTVTDDGVTGLTGASEIKENQIKIDDKVFVNDTGLTDVLGYAVEGFYKYDEEEDQNILIYAFINEKKVNVLEINDIDLIKYDDKTRTYEYYTDKDQYEDEEAELNKNFKIIYNGRAYSVGMEEDSFTKTVSQMLMPEYGWVRLIDTDGDNKYNLVVVKDYQMVVVAGIDVENYIIFGNPKYTDVEVDLFDARNEFVIKNSLGSTFAIDSIASGSVLSIAKSADGKYAEVLYSNLVVKGTLGSVDGRYYCIDETDYIATKDFMNHVAKLEEKGEKSITAGTYGNFYVTFDNKIAYFKDASEAAIKVGYLGNLGTDGSMDISLKIKIVTTASSLNLYETAERVTVDGKVFKDLEALEDYLAPFKGKLIRYKLNSDEKINFIDTPYVEGEINPNYATESDDSLHILKGGNHETAFYMSSTQSFGGNFIVDTNTTAFIYNTNAKKPLEEIVVTDINNASIKTRKAYTITAYATEVGTLIAEYVVYDLAKMGTTVDTYNPTTGVVLKITDTIDEEGEPIKKLLMTTDATTYYDYYAYPETLVCTCGAGDCATNPVVVSAGDIVNYGIDGTLINDLRVCYDYSKKEVITPGSNTYFDAYNKHAFNPADIDGKQQSSRKMQDTNTVVPVSYINKIQGSVMQMMFKWWPFCESTSVPTEMMSGVPVMKTLSAANMFVIKVDAKKGTFEPVKLSELKTYNDGAGVKQEAVFYNQSGTAKWMVIYK